jgi:hypothetical protein
VVERDDGPASWPQRRCEGPQGHTPVRDIVQHEGTGDAVERRGLRWQRLGQIGNQEPAPPAAAALSFLDHPRAHVDADDPGALAEQPLGLCPRTATGIQHDGTRQIFGTSDRRAGRSSSPLYGPSSVVADHTAASRSYASRVLRVCSAWSAGLLVVI